MPPCLLEIAADSIVSALAAQAGGANRVELFSNPFEGGVTPSEGLITVVRERLTIPLHVLIRPRGGDFLYSKEEFDAMQLDIAMAKRLGAQGVVLGMLDIDGNIDVERTRELVAAARPLHVTFHRAFDMSADLLRSLNSLHECGVDNVLTSGGEATAVNGIPILAKLAAASSEIQIIAAGGINNKNVREIMAKTGVNQVHAGLRSKSRSPMRYRNERISFGPISGQEYERTVVREEDVKALAEEMRQS